AREAEAKVESLAPQTLMVLAGALEAQKGDAVPLLTAAQRRYTDDFWLNFTLGNALSDAKRPGEAVGYYPAALALRPEASVAYTNLGVALSAQGDVAGALACYRKALELGPKSVLARYNLGVVLSRQGDTKGAIACFEKALELDPKNALVHSNL